MRVFAGPNGSGKSTVIENVRSRTVNGNPIDFGIYVNADEIGKVLQKSPLRFNKYTIKTSEDEFRTIALASGLINSANETSLFKCYKFERNSISLLNPELGERLAQIIADFIRKKLLSDQKKFSFETVFSHPGKLDIMREAASMGYKVYLYFVSTESADINVYRVAARKEKGGHDVPEERIRNRYGRSLNFLYEACQIAYQVFFFDNSDDGTDAALFAHFKKYGNKKKWDITDEANLPIWFHTYYSEKVRDKSE